MVKRTSLVWKRPDLTDADFRTIWLGEHVNYARMLPGVREYTIDFVKEPPEGAPNAIATLRFDSREQCEAAFSIPHIREGLMATRERFAGVVQVFFVDETPVIPLVTEDARNLR